MAEPDGGAEAVPEAASDASRGSRGRTGGFRRPGAFGWLLLAVAIAGAVVLVIAEFSEISKRTIGAGACSERVGDPAICAPDGPESHGYALLILAIVALPMACGAIVGRSRAAAIAVAALGIGALGIALLIDRPKLDDKRDLDCCYSQVRVYTGPAFKLVLIGGVLLVLLCGLSLASDRQVPWALRRL